MPLLIGVDVGVKGILPILFDEPLGVFYVCSALVEVTAGTLGVDVPLVPAERVAGPRTKMSSL